MIVSYSLDATPLRNLSAAIRAEGRRVIAAVTVNGLLTLFRRHLIQASRSRHRTADRLGAPRTGHWEEAARTLTARYRDDGGDLLIAGPGIRRAFGPLVVRPKRAKALTIPLSAPAYGVRVGELEDRGWIIRRVKSVLVGNGPDGKAIPLYALKAKVTLPHDPGLLPSKSARRAAVTDAVSRAFARIAEKTKGARHA